MNAQTAVQRRCRLLQLGHALGGCLSVPGGLLRLPGVRLRLRARRAETLVERLALRLQGGDALRQRPCRLYCPVRPRGQLCRLRQRAACVLDGLRQCRRLAGQSLRRLAVRSRLLPKCVDPGRRRANGLQDLPDGVVVRTGLRRCRCGRRSCGAGSPPDLRPFRPADQKVATVEIVVPRLRAAAPVLRRHDCLPAQEIIVRSLCLGGYRGGQAQWQGFRVDLP